MWTNNDGSMYRCCPMELDSYSQPSGAALRKLNEKEVVVNMSGYFIYDVSTNTTSPISSVAWRPGSLKRSGAFHAWFLLDPAESNPSLIVYRRVGSPFQQRTPCAQKYYDIISDFGFAS